MPYNSIWCFCGGKNWSTAFDNIVSNFDNLYIFVKCHLWRLYWTIFYVGLWAIYLNVRYKLLLESYSYCCTRSTVLFTSTNAVGECLQNCKKILYNVFLFYSWPTVASIRATAAIDKIYLQYLTIEKKYVYCVVTKLCFTTMPCFQIYCHSKIPSL